MSKNTLSIPVGATVLVAALLIAGKSARATVPSEDTCSAIGCGGGSRGCADVQVRNPECGEPELMCCPFPETETMYCGEAKT